MMAWLDPFEGRAATDVVAWGYYVRDTGGPPFPVAISDYGEDLSDVVAFAAGVGQDVALRRDGTVVVWGDNAYGQRWVPAGLDEVVGIASGAWHVVALRADGTAAQWGSNLYGEANWQVEPANLAAVTAGFFETVALRSDGTVTAWGPVSATPVPPGLSNVVAVATDNQNALAVKADGRVEGWNLNQGGLSWRPLFVPPEATNVIEAAVGSGHFVALRADGTVVGWDLGESGVGMVPEGLTEVTAIAAGHAHVLALRRNGAVVAWGAGTSLDPVNPPEYGQSMVPPGLSNVVAVAAGGFHSLALVGDGPPSIAQPLVDRMVVWGGSAFLHVRTSGRPPFAYQWHHNGQPLAEGTNALLTLTQVDLEDAGGYSVAITNAMGGMVSRQLRLGIAPFFITHDPEDQVAFPGWTVRFEVVVESTLPLRYQWQREGVDLAGATNAVLLLDDVQTQDTGHYTVVVTNDAGSARSRDARLSFTEVLAWGSNSLGQTNVPAGLTNIGAIAAGANHSLALKRDGSVVAWGLDLSGQASVPTELGEITAVAAGSDFNLALRSDATVMGWGNNYDGQCQPPAGLSDIVQIAAGGRHGLALRSNGTVAAWGFNGSGQCTVPADLTDVVQVAAGLDFSVAVRRNGKVVTWGKEYTTLPLETPVPLTNVVAVAAGGSHFIALRADGTIDSRGLDRHTPMIGSTELTNMIAIAAGGGNNAAFRADGSLRFWGTNPRLPGLSGPPAETAAGAVAMGLSHGVMQIAEGPPRLTSPGVHAQVVSGETACFHATAVGARPLHFQWQFNGEALTGETNAILTVPRVDAGDVGSYSVVVSNALGAIHASLGSLEVLPLRLTAQPAGQSTYLGNSITLAAAAEGPPPLEYQWFFDGQPLVGSDRGSLVLSNLQLEQAGRYHVEVRNSLGSISSREAIVSVGLVAAWDDQGRGQTNLPTGLTNVLTIAAGPDYNLILGANGAVTVWGTASAVQSDLPDDLTNAVAVAAGYGHALALRRDGTIAGWGDNAYGQLDLATGSNRAVAISAGGWHSLALLADGTVVGAGANEYNQVNLPWWDLFDIVAISAGAYHNLALRNDGTVVAWGDNGKGQTTLPVDLTNAVAVAAGGEFSLALRNDGTVAAWGGNDHGELMVPSGLNHVVAIAAGYFRALALTRDGRVIGWGEPGDGPGIVPEGLPAAVAIAAGPMHGLALLRNPAAPAELAIRDARLTDEGFGAWLDSQSGRVYALEYADQLTGSEWIRLPLVAGNGSELALLHHVSNGTRRYYRLLRW